MTCPTCNSLRCGNHAACARRGVAVAQWRVFCDSWVMIGACEAGVQKMLAQMNLMQRVTLAAVGESRLRIEIMGRLLEE